MNGKRITMGIYALVAFMILSGCTTKGDVTKEEPQKSETVIRIGIGGNARTPMDLELVNKELGRLSEEKIGVRMEMVTISSKNISMMLNDKENPVDIVSLSNEDYKAQRKYLLPINDILQKYGKNIINLLGEDVINLGEFKGVLYGVSKPMPDIHTTGVAMLTKYIEKYQIDIDGIRSMADFESVLQTIKKHEPEMIPYVPERTGREAISREVIGDVLAGNLAMIYYDDASLNVANLYETPEYEKKIRMIRDWYLKGYLSKDILTNSELGLSQVSAGIAFSTEFVYRPDELQAAKEQYKDTITYISFKDRPYLSTSSNTAYYWCIPKQSKKGEDAMKALDLMYTDKDIINVILYGVEGVHYIETADGHITYPIGVTADNVGYRNKSEWKYNRNIGKVWEGGSLDIYQIMGEFNASAIKSPAYGFQFNEENLPFDNSKLSKVIDKYALKLGCGVLDVDSQLPKFQEELRAAGSDQLVTEVQKQLNRWKESKE